MDFSTGFENSGCKTLNQKIIVDCQDVANYCPISNLSFISKLLQRAVLQLRDHLEDHNFLWKFQRL